MQQFLDALRVKSYETALDELKQLSMGRIKLVPPTTAAPSTEQAAAPTISVVSSTTRRATRANTSGLF
jgi:hypothetical protein